MRFLTSVLLVVFFAVASRAQYLSPFDDDYFVMADPEYDLDNDFDIMGGVTSLPVLSSKAPITLPIQSSSKSPITLPVQAATRQLITLPVQTSKGQAIHLPNVVHKTYTQQPITQYQMIEQPIIQPRLIEQPKLQQRIVTQPVYRQIVTQPVIVPQITHQPIINQRVVDQPIIQHRLIENTVVQPQLIEIPVTNKAIQAQPTHLNAQAITNRQSMVAQPIYQNAPTLTQAPVTAPMQMPVSSKKSAGYSGLAGLGAQNLNLPQQNLPAGLYGLQGLGQQNMAAMGLGSEEDDGTMGDQ